MFDIKFDDEKRTLTFSGRMSAASVGQADDALNSIKGDCTVDFRGLEYISSAGIGSLLKTYLRLKETGHTMKLVNLNRHISEVLRYSGLDKVLTIE